MSRNGLRGGSRLYGYVVGRQPGPELRTRRANASRTARSPSAASEVIDSPIASGDSDIAKAIQAQQSPSSQTSSVSESVRPRAGANFTLRPPGMTADSVT